VTVIDNLTQRGNRQSGRRTHGMYSTGCTKSLHYWNSTNLLPMSNATCNLSNLFQNLPCILQYVRSMYTC